MVMDKETGRSKGFGYVQYVEAADAAKAMAQMNDSPGPNYTGLVLAADGRKMNYSDPMELVHKYGADTLRQYLINSPVVRAENLRFKEDDIKDVFLLWFNKIVYRYDAGRYASKRSTNVMDVWITSFKESQLEFVAKEMKAKEYLDDIKSLVNFILDELNVRDIILSSDKQKYKQVIHAVKVLTDPQIAEQLKLGFFSVLGHRIKLNELRFIYQFDEPKHGNDSMGRHGHLQKLRHIELHGQQQQRFDRQPTKTPTSRRSMQRTTTTVADLL
ncbi:hypothetical protein pipiens_014034 [Culex pipiens pipiens]|uniref:RRM domain-containing protein n=1 Tax=Culex pipiens pipiens TaxID=38569 RepID=A0ABD1CW38_CULPP